MYGETFYGRHTAQHQLQWKTLYTHRFRHLKQFDESDSYNKYYWPNSKWSQTYLMYISNII